MRKNHDIGMIMLGFLINLCQTIRLPKVIPVQKREIFTFCGGNSFRLPLSKNNIISRRAAFDIRQFP